MADPLRFVIRPAANAIATLDSPDSFAPSAAVVIVVRPTVGDSLESRVKFRMIFGGDGGWGKTRFTFGSRACGERDCFSPVDHLTRHSTAAGHFRSYTYQTTARMG